MPHDELADLVARATAAADPSADPLAAQHDQRADQRRRERALAALVPVLVRSARESGIRAVAAGRWLADLVLEMAPRLPVRDAAALRRQHPSLTDIELAQQLIRTATKTTAALGAAAGGLAAVEFFAPPALLAAPVQLAAEILTVTAVELKLVAELHEILGYPAHGSVTDRAGLYLMSWVRRRAVAEQAGPIGVGAVLGVAAKRELRSQLLRRLGRSTTSLAPFLAGAVAGAEVNRRATTALGHALLAELRGRAEERWFRRL